MLVAKLTKPVEKIYQKQGLETETITAQYLAASAADYTLGDSNAKFYYKVGKVEFDETDKPVKFDRVIYGNIELNEEEVAQWGTDDTVALNMLAVKLGVEVDSFLTIEGERFKA
jgi:hypothetical protein